MPAVRGHVPLHRADQIPAADTCRVKHLGKTLEIIIARGKTQVGCSSGISLVKPVRWDCGRNRQNGYRIGHILSFTAEQLAAQHLPGSGGEPVGGSRQRVGQTRQPGGSARDILANRGLNGCRGSFVPDRPTKMCCAVTSPALWSIGQTAHRAAPLRSAPQSSPKHR